MIALIKNYKIILVGKFLKLCSQRNDIRLSHKKDVFSILILKKFQLLLIKT